MTMITYEFEQLEPYPGLCVYVSGQADIVGQWDGADPDVGIMHGGWDYTVEDIRIDSSKIGEPPVDINRDHPLYDLIIKQLHSRDYSDYIQGELGDASTPDADDWRD